MIAAFIDVLRPAAALGGIAAIVWFGPDVEAWFVRRDRDRRARRMFAGNMRERPRPPT